MGKLVVIGLDCATPQLIFEKWKGMLPVLESLMAAGVHGPLVSTIPPITVPAWTAMMTSQDPGQLGFYGFRNRADHGYDRLVIADSSQVKARTVWQHLSRARLTSLVLGVPQTWPPRPLAGSMAACFLSPGHDAPFTYPPEFKARLDEAAGGEYIIDVADFRTDDKQRLLEAIREMTRRRFLAFRNLFGPGGYDFGMLVEMGTDRIHHGFWRFFDQEHRLYTPGNPYESAVLDYYRLVDQELGLTLAALPQGTSVMVVSDHGARGMRGALCINEWLRAQGLLKLTTEPSSQVRLVPEMVDWSRTRVWGDGGYYGRIFINVKGREPEGVVPPEDLPAFLEELAQAILAIPDEQGRPLGSVVYKPAEIYRAVNGVPPDLIVYFGDLAWRSSASVGTGTLHLFENDTGPDDANHDREGIFLWDRPDAAKAERYSIYDIAPSILHHFNLPQPPEMIGSSLLPGDAR